VASAAQKRDALRDLLASEDVKNAFIFCNRKRDIAALERSLQKAGFNAGALHGDMAQPARVRTMEAFKKGEISLLVCSDIAARGIDVEGLSHVFNFDVPHHAEDYVHRIGRTGRAGNNGRAFTIATAEDEKYVAAIVSLIGKAIPQAGVTLAEESHVSAAPSPREPVPAMLYDGVQDQETRSVTRKPPRRAPHKEEFREPRPNRRYRDDDGPDQSVIGFGDHMPAFLRVRAR
jgi:superfamily II DNA/RNA helicase